VHTAADRGGGDGGVDQEGNVKRGGAGSARSPAAVIDLYNY
jgi:hypothetical protein